MKKIRKWFRTPAVTAVALVLAIGLLAFAGIGAAMAILNRISDTYVAKIDLDEIGVTLNENGEPVANRDYNKKGKSPSEIDGTFEGTVSGILTLSEVGEKDKDDIIFNKQYPEELTVTNSGLIDEYVRVSVYRYWLDENDKKLTDLDPKLIGLYLGDTDLDKAAAAGSWKIDQDPTASTVKRGGERLVLYHQGILKAGEETTPFLDKISVSNEIATEVEKITTGNSIRTVYMYDGAQFCLEVTVDAVQDHNPAEAIKGAWGTEPSLLGVSE